MDRVVNHPLAWFVAGTVVLLVAKRIFRHRFSDRDMPWLVAVRDILDKPHGRGVELPVEILPHLLLGDKRCAGDLATMDAFGITHILNVAGTHGRASDAAARHYLEIHADDEEGYPIVSQHLAQASAFIRTARDEGGRCLIHCQAGVNRSACLAVAELMLSERLPVVQAVARAKRARGVLLSNHSFQAQLVALARTNDLLGPEPDVSGRTLPTRLPRRSAADALSCLG